MNSTNSSTEHDLIADKLLSMADKPLNNSHTIEHCQVCKGRVIIKDLDKYFCGYCNNEIKNVDNS